MSSRIEHPDKNYTYTMHDLRLRGMAITRKHLQEKKKVHFQDLKVFIMERARVSSITASKYIYESVELGVATIDKDGIVYYSFDKKEIK